MADRQEQELDQQQQTTGAGGTAVVDDAGLTAAEVEEQAKDIGVRPEYFEEEYSPEEYEEMLQMYEETLTDIGEGQIVKATVQRVTDNAVILDVGFKSEGAVPIDEFRSGDELEPGAEVDVFLESLEDQDGIVVLSKKKADFLKVWEKIKHAYDNDLPVPGTLARKIKGGVTVDLMGVDAFLPGSQIALRRVPNVEELLGNQYEFKIIKLNKRRRNIVVSRRVLLEKEREKKREHLVKELMVGQVRAGIVKNVTDFGAFIDLGGLDGLLHITDMSWGRVGHPSEIVSIGDTMDVKVLDIDWDRERISLGLKQLLPYPWKDIENKYPVGARIKGRVVSITNYGAFIELEKGVEGLVHVSEMSWTRNVKHPSQLVSINDVIECVVLRVDKDEEKISLGIKQTEEDPWLALPVKYPTGTRVTGKVRNLTSFGAFVEIEPGIDGLIHISDMSWTKRIEHPSEVVRKGEDVEVVILNVDAENKRISLGLKQTEEDPWYRIAEEYSPDVETNGRVVRILDEGVVVDLGDDIEGFVPKSQTGIDNPKDLTDHFEEDQRLELRVTESDPVNRRIHLTVTAMPEREGATDAEADADAATEAEAEEVAAEAVAAADEGAEEAEEPEAPSEEEATEEPAASADSEEAEEPEEPEASAEEEEAETEAAETEAAEEAEEEEAAASATEAAKATDGAETDGEAADEDESEDESERAADGGSEPADEADEAEAGEDDDDSDEGPKS